MLALHPADFAGGAAAPDGSCWIIGEDEYTRNPRLTVPPGVREMVRLYQYFRGGMGGSGYLPSDIDRQSVLTLDGFDVIAAAFREFDKKPPSETRE